jgi:nucleoside-diphosphate-sugar epimerase
MSDWAILVTGAAGFTGFHVARGLSAEGRNVLGPDGPAMSIGKTTPIRRFNHGGMRRDFSHIDHGSGVVLQLADRIFDAGGGRRRCGPAMSAI